MTSIPVSTLQLAELALNTLASAVYDNNVKAGWFKNPVTGRKLDVDPLQKLMLIVTEISEAAEGVRKDIPDTHLTHRKMEEVEIADALVRIFEYAGWRGLDIGGAFVEKIHYNAQRADHKLENRAQPGGKKC